MKTKVVEKKGNKITIWKMNFGFRSDYQGDTTITTYKKVNKGGKDIMVRDVKIDNGKMILMTLVYGIFESTDMGIPAPKNLKLGLTPEEKEMRLEIIRSLDYDLDDVFTAIQEINEEVDEEIIKKSATPSTEN